MQVNTNAVQSLLFIKYEERQNDLSVNLLTLNGKHLYITSYSQKLRNELKYKIISRNIPSSTVLTSDQFSWSSSRPLRGDSARQFNFNIAHLNNLRRKCVNITLYLYIYCRLCYNLKIVSKLPRISRGFNCQYN